MSIPFRRLPPGDDDDDDDKNDEDENDDPSIDEQDLDFALPSATSTVRAAAAAVATSAEEEAHRLFEGGIGELVAHLTLEVDASLFPTESSLAVCCREMRRPN